MRSYDNTILEEIRDELSIIWAAHKVHGLKGKMRIYTPTTSEFWHNKEEGAEMWFDPSEIDAAVKKIGLFYREGRDNKSVLMLDPMVYSFNNEGKPLPQGSGIVWATILTPTHDKDERFNNKTLLRLKELGLFCTPFRMPAKDGQPENKRAGLKIIGFLKTPITSKNRQYSPNGTLTKAMDEIADIIDAPATIMNQKHPYILSGLQYTIPELEEIQHPRFKKLMGDRELATVDDLTEISIEPELLTNASICWNAYQRDHNLYLRYGIDVVNLKSNLASKAENDKAVEKIKRELLFFWRVNLRHGMDGFMRLYTSPNQDNWRSFEEGKTIWFTHQESSLSDAAEQIQRLYNGGMLPNTPVLLDPIVYSQLSDGSYIPVGTAIIWSTCLNVGLDFFNEAGEKRIKELGLLTGRILRAGEDLSGIKAIGFLDKPYLFSQEDVMRFLEDPEDDTDDEKEDDLSFLYGSQSNDNDDIDDPDEITPEEDENTQTFDYDDDDDDDDDDDENNMDDPFFKRDYLPIPPSLAINQLYGSNAENYANFFLLSGMEYLCTNGSFTNPALEDSFGITEQENYAIIDKYTVSYQKIVDAYDCWEAYDHVELLWKKYGIDKENLEKNLQYYVLCGRNFEFLAMLDQPSGEAIDEEDNTDSDFKFIVDSMVAKNTVTVLAGANIIGKSTLGHKLALLTSCDYAEGEEPETWLGSKIRKENCEGLTIYFSGKDPEVVCKSRANLMIPDKHPSRLMVKYGNDFGENDEGEPLSIIDFLKKLSSLPEVSLVVIDSARKYIPGDEDDKEAVASFFDALQKFSSEKNCAILLLHHTERDQTPDKSTEILPYLKGCDLFGERPSVIIGLLKDGPRYYAGLAKNGLPPNLETIKGERVFARNEERLNLDQLPGDEGIRVEEPI